MLEGGIDILYRKVQGVVLKSSLSQLLDFQNPSSDVLRTF
jgi:hypothetical protein